MGPNLEPQITAEQFARVTRLVFEQHYVTVVNGDTNNGRDWLEIDGLVWALVRGPTHHSFVDLFRIAHQLNPAGCHSLLHNL
ncbi:hypothetical protein KAM329D_38750 [Aeromonas caviae]|uniref:Uncharacterized protein n=1 Tax=Aeromonas caviae TaxID=648 RepID=A0AAV4YN87_AERCA|nr:hypothetical protein KAM341_20870 [Aeromonas caviae]GJA38464.1 hypothetical protein KAM342_37070 [Aeromonas caviae]GJA41398.1 hypothetical protein KAM343_21940 [Aeromonas caviae]GJA49674.1 hypothetical protein KAM347_14650 [Aeromonas caviae]GJA58566.1 hypothetical protein KAM350_15590 [Aeromonas caviae]